MLDEAFSRLIVRELERSMLYSTGPLRYWVRQPMQSRPSSDWLPCRQRIFERIASQVDPALPEGERWHIELLNQVARPSESRPAVISEQSRQALRDYLAFRHRSRHAYAHQLMWSGMAQLVIGVLPTWDGVRSEILRFIPTAIPLITIY